MPFDSGSISLAICRLDRDLPEDALARFAANRGCPLQLVNDKPHIGWVTGRHLLDTNITDETAYAGGYIHLCLRTAQRKVPTSLLQAECRMAELAMMAEKQKDGLGRRERKLIREETEARLISDMPPTLSGISFVYDPPQRLVYVGASSLPKLDAFLQGFRETLELNAEPLTPEQLLEDDLELSMDRVQPLSFAPAMEQLDDGAGIGQDFATWLWYFQDEEGGELKVADLGEFAIMIDGPLVLSADGPGALESVIRKGVPTLSAEAKAALMVGKKISKAKYTVARPGQTWEFSLDAKHFILSGLKLPPGEEMEFHAHFAERILALDILRRVLLALYRRFAEQVTDPDRAAALQRRLQKWVSELRSL